MLLPWTVASSPGFSLPKGSLHMAPNNLPMDFILLCLTCIPDLARITCFWKAYMATVPTPLSPPRSFMTGMDLHFDFTRLYHGRWDDDLLHSSGANGRRWEEKRWHACTQPFVATFRKRPCCPDTRPLVDLFQVLSGSGFRPWSLQPGFRWSLLHLSLL